MDSKRKKVYKSGSLWLAESLNFLHISSNPGLFHHLLRVFHKISQSVQTSASLQLQPSLEPATSSVMRRVMGYLCWCEAFTCSSFTRVLRTPDEQQDQCVQVPATHRVLFVHKKLMQRKCLEQSENYVIQYTDIFPVEGNTFNYYIIIQVECLSYLFS